MQVCGVSDEQHMQLCRVAGETARCHAKMLNSCSDNLVRGIPQQIVQHRKYAAGRHCRMLLLAHVHTRFQVCNRLHQQICDQTIQVQHVKTYCWSVRYTYRIQYTSNSILFERAFPTCICMQLQLHYANADSRPYTGRKQCMTRWWFQKDLISATPASLHKPIAATISGVVFVKQRKFKSNDSICSKSHNATNTNGSSESDHNTL